MRAIAIYPGKGDPHFTTIEEPKITLSSQVILETIQVGICGTDRDQISGGRADAGKESNELIIGHEMLGRVIETGKDVRSCNKDDFALFTVRRGCGKCNPCNNKRSDFCYTGEYQERGIKGLNGYQAEYIIDEADYLVGVPDEISTIGILTEPMSVVEKAIDESLKIQAGRIPGFYINDGLKGRNIFIAGLGPVGLLSALILKIKGANLFGVDIVHENSPRAHIFKKLGGKYINGKKTKIEDVDNQCGKFDLVLDATGVAKLEFQLPETLAANGIYVITGIPEGERPISIFGSKLISNMVLNNQVILGSVNAGIKHYQMAVDDLVTAYQNWGDIVEMIITEKVPAEEFKRAFAFNQDEIKTVIEWKKL